MTVGSVAILIVNWNGRTLLQACLESSLRQDYSGEVTVLVIDNGSTDGSPEYVEEQFPDVLLLRNRHNNYTSANNLGVHATETEFVLLLNSDARLDPSCLQILVDSIQPHSDVAGSAPKILYPDGRLYTTGIQETDDLYWFDRDQGKADQGDVESEEVFGISGCCALFRRDAWLRAGGQDEDFHMYYEDVDFCLRLRDLGYRFLYVPEARATHIGRASIKKAPDNREELGDRNRLMTLAAHYPQRFMALAATSSWLRSARREDVLTLLPKLAQHLGVEESHLDSELTLRMRNQRTGVRNWSLRRRIGKIARGLRNRLSRS